MRGGITRYKEWIEMNRIALYTAAAALFLAGSAQAQQPAPERQRTEASGKRAGAPRARIIMRGIELSDAQREQIRQVHEKYRPQMQELRQQTATARRDSQPLAELRSRSASLNQAQQQEIRAVLTTEQRQTYDANVTRMRERAAMGRQRIRQHGEARRDGARGRGETRRDSLRAHVEARRDSARAERAGTSSTRPGN